MRPIIVPVAVLATLVALVVGGLVVERQNDHLPRGEGSYEAAARLLVELKQLRRDGTGLPAGYYRIPCDNNTWYVATGIDSHGGPDGGTVGILTSDGEIEVIFTHVCGRGEMPLYFGLGTARDVLAGLRRTAVVYSAASK